MLQDKTFEQEINDLIHDAEEERKKSQQRLEAARTAMETANKKLEAALIMLKAYRVKYGLAKPEIAPVTEVPIEYQNKTFKTILREWADNHGGIIVINDVADALLVAGLFKTKQRATGTLYPTVTRQMKDFRKIAPGKFQRINHLAADDLFSDKDKIS